MVLANVTNDVFECEVCRFHYEDEAKAEECEKWCREHKSCNLEITRFALENQSRG